jgi:hypothetical protein
MSQTTVSAQVLGVGREEYILVYVVEDGSRLDSVRATLQIDVKDLLSQRGGIAAEIRRTTAHPRAAMSTLTDGGLARVTYLPSESERNRYVEFEREEIE